MGYSYTFSGQFRVKPQLTKAHSDYLRAFAHSRRVKRDPQLLRAVEDPLRTAAGLPVGPEGCYFVGTTRHDLGENTSELNLEWK
jgi:hypothetical protein